jgi:HK97 gp10 family phage protein
VGVTFAIDGIEELRASLQELGDAIAKKVAVEANRDAAEVLQGLLKKAAPFDPTFRKKYWLRKNLTVQTGYYGHLRDAIEVRRVKARNANYIVHKVSTGDAFWGYFLEFGTVKMGARPWFRPVLDANAKRLQGIQIEGLRKGIEGEAARIGRTRGRRAAYGRRATEA